MTHAALLLVPTLLSPGCSVIVRREAQQATEEGRRRAPQGSTERASQAASFLEERGQQLGSTEMEALALRVRSNPSSLDVVKVLLRNMLHAAHADDVGLHQFCSSEKQKSKDSVTTQEDRCEKAHADLDKLSVQADQAKQKIADLHAEVAALGKTLASAAALRAAEKTAYEASREKLLQEESVHRATRENIDVEQTAARAAEEALAEAAIGQRVKLEMVEDAAAQKFERRQQQGQQSIKVKTEGAKLEGPLLLKMQADLVDQRHDAKGLEEELAATKDYAQQIDKKCTVPADTHNDEKRRRNEQLSSLKHAYDILSGDDDAALTL